MKAHILTADGPNGKLLAAVDPGVHHVEGRVANRKFAALLTPFKDPQSARAALEAAGAAEVREYAR
jgi:hypothetical protein